MQRPRLIVAAAGALAVVYTILVLGYIATAPDLGIRCLLFDSDEELAGNSGVVIRSTAGLREYRGEQKPAVGDILLRVREQSTPTFIHFARQVGALRDARIPDGGKLQAGTDPGVLTNSMVTLPSLLEIGEGERWVEIEFSQRESEKTYVAWLPVESLPFSEVLLSLVWFGLQMGVFGVGALAYWSRPFDRSSQTFFAMCIVTLAASLGAYHWWVVAANLWLLIPCVLCALLVPAVSLHFFVEFPRPKAIIARYPGQSLAAIYALPVVTAIGVLGLFGYVASAAGGGDGSESSVAVREMLGHLRSGIYGFAGVGVVYFLVTLLVIRTSLQSTRNALEFNQLQWIWRATLTAALFIALTSAFAYFDRTQFALGPGRIPVFLASLSFMLAYTVGIIRYKLMLVDQVVSKGVLYYVVTYGLALAVSVAIALATMIPGRMNIALSTQQSFSTAAVIILLVVLLMWVRDAVQRTVDQKFFREKYQLDKALRRLNRAASHLADPQSLAQMMLTSCRDALGVQRAALYLRTRTSGQFRLVAAIGADDLSLQITASDELIESLSHTGSLQRATPGSRNMTSSVQLFLRYLQAGLIHALEAEEGIVGLVVLGEKQNSAPFTAEDLTFLNALGQISNVALYSAKLDGEIVRLNEELRLKIEKISEQQRQMAVLQSEITSRQRDDDPAERKAPQPGDFRRDVVIGNSPAIQQVLSTVRKVAASESSVLIRGESGTGKELLAEILHSNSPRHGGPLVCVHCASLSPNLLESELFGHVKGSFTGAHRDRVGRFEMATGGTLFLDEIGDISLETQIKLLRVLQERCFEPVGGSRTVQVDVRLITATHQNLEQLITEHRFREDLYYRLNVISVTLPPLRERRADILELAIHFLGRATKRVGKRITHMNDDVLAALERHRWPGNVRELENAIERAVVLADGEEIMLHDLPDEFQTASSEILPPDFESRPMPASRPLQVPPPYVSSVVRSLSYLDDSAERAKLERALLECRGNKAEAARKLGMPRSTFFSKLKKHQLDKVDLDTLARKRQPSAVLTTPAHVSRSERARFLAETSEELRKLEEQLQNRTFEDLTGDRGPFAKPEQ